ncbi:RNA polymerase II mediator complex subunit [Parahypoxylon ruwenzoriense]
MAVPQRQPQRTLSGSGLSQSPVHHRTISQQYLPPSPVRKSESFSEQSSDAGDVVQGRYNTIPRRGGSRLKLELANDGIEHAGFSESPQNLDLFSANKAFTPSRVMSMNDASDAGDMTPRTSRCHTVDEDLTPLPMPPRRARFVVPTKRPELSTLSTPLKKDTRPKPFVIETPSIAPRYPNMGKAEPIGKTMNKDIGGRHADFYPWNGGHAEDQFSDNIIRHGFFDKAPAQSTQEPASAKAPLFPALKHKSGLHTLSTIFTGILNQRRHSGQITSASTFKPPPRVTLTDTKREIWLKDLANPAISLRRLSRTIPHGIRGKVLLDQCLNKNVPTDRAVWLAKCVGANEIRAFKRKGVNGTFVMGGEAKWIRDWTVFVEQFVEAVASAFAENDWKSKVTYAIRLATHLYAEHLLDRDHYMDWLVSGLENTNQAKLPMWLLIIQIYWKDLLRLRRHGRRLVSAILSHHSSIYHHPDRDILLPLSTRLQSLIESVILTSPENLINPGTWFKYRDSLVEPPASNNNETGSKAFKTIDSRNDYLTSSNAKSQPALRSIVVQLLDSIHRTPLDDTIPKRLWRTSENKSFIVRTVLEWCTSLYRPGIAKVYVATMLLRSSLAFDLDITGAVLDFLDVDPLRELARKQLVYHVVSELVRSGDFSVPQYIQWLIARGGIINPVETDRDGPCITRLLVEIPTYCLNESMKNLRATLLRRACFAVEDEARDIAMAISCVKNTLSIPLGLDDPIFPKKPISVKKLSQRIELSSRTLKTTVSSWLSSDFVGEIAQNLQSGKGGIELPKAKFETIRTLLEAAQDFTMLENVVRFLMPSSNAELLACCADTVNLHLPVFAATGAAKPLFQAFYERLKCVVEEQGVGSRPLLASLTNLAPRLAGLDEVAAQLQSDLIRTDRSSAADASSPLSDNMATQLQDAETELSEQIEKLASYTSADRPTMERLFHAIIMKLQNYWGKADERQRLCCILLTRLRVFDIQHFNTLMRGWVQHIRKLTNRPPIAQLFPPLISSGCLSLAILFATAPRSQLQATQFQPSAVGSASIYMQEILQMLMMPFSPNPVMTSEDCYRIRIIQDHARREHAKEIMPLIRGALAEYSASRNQQASIPQPLDDVQTELLELLRGLVLVDPNAASQTLSLKSPDPKLAALIETWTTKLLVPHGGGGQKSFEQVLELANEFTLPFCQVKLSLNLAIDDTSGPEGSEKLQSQFELLSKAIDNAIDANNIMWTGMLPSLNPDITQHMKNRAESRFLDIIPSLKNPSGEHFSDRDIHMAENLLTVIDAIFRGGSGTKASPISSALVDKLADLWDILSSRNSEYAILKATVLSHWLPLLFSYLTLFTSPSTGAVDVSKLHGGEIRGRALIVLAGLVQELDSYPSSQLGEKALDIALALVDGLPEDARLLCVRAVKDATSDSRIRYLFSFAPNPAEDLMLAHREKPPQGIHERRALALGIGMGMIPEKLTPFLFRRWEILNEPTPNVGENDTSLSLTLFDARKIK